MDVIYIDPPYNTGNKSWKYNNNYVVKDDRYRHSKWLSFMYKRLRLAKNLLTDDGIIIVTIDDYELFYLGALMDEIFQNNRLGVITIIHNRGGRDDSKSFATCHEYALVYAKNSNNAVINELQLTEEQKNKYKQEDEISKYDDSPPLMRGGSNSGIEDRPNMHYPIYLNPETEEIFVEKPGKQKCITIYPINDKGEKKIWRWGKDKLARCWKTEIVIKKKTKNGYSLYLKKRIKEGKRPKTVWDDSKYNASSHGTILLKNIFQEKKVFDYPKSLYAVKDFIEITTKHKKDAIILDFFAGSGTTGHAVLQLNKEDGGNRQFILCTNNENNNGNGSGGVAETVCYPRIKKVIEGYVDRSGKEIEGLGGNLIYYKTAFTNNIKTDNDKRIFTNKSTEIICLAENTFEKLIRKEKQYAIFQNSKQITGIIYDEDYLTDFKEEIKKYEKPFVIYLFSYNHTHDEKYFTDIKNLIEVKPIPEVFLNVYRKIYKNLYKPRRT